MTAGGLSVGQPPLVRITLDPDYEPQGPVPRGAPGLGFFAGAWRAIEFGYGVRRRVHGEGLPQGVRAVAFKEGADRVRIVLLAASAER